MLWITKCLKLVSVIAALKKETLRFRSDDLKFKHNVFHNKMLKIDGVSRGPRTMCNFEKVAFKMHSVTTTRGFHRLQ